LPAGWTPPSSPGDTLDSNPDLSPTWCADAETCESVPLHAYDFVLADPPYSKEHTARRWSDRWRLLNGIDTKISMLRAGLHFLSDSLDDDGEAFVMEGLRAWLVRLEALHSRVTPSRPIGSGPPARPLHILPPHLWWQKWTCFSAGEPQP